jgi:hypothetical protein
MRSRSYSTIRIGSTLLVLTACPSDVALSDSDKVKYERAPEPVVLPDALVEPEEPCPEGQMFFEGVCTPKTEVVDLVEHREEEALLDLQEPAQEGGSAEAQHRLIEQQIVQVEKAEDDLDEIILELERDKFDRAVAERRHAAPER